MIQDIPHHYRPTREGVCDKCGRRPRSHRAMDAQADAYYAPGAAEARRAAAPAEEAFTAAWCEVHHMAHVCAYAGVVFVARDPRPCYCLALLADHLNGAEGCAFNADWTAR